jgi:hypothetical protein
MRKWQRYTTIFSLVLAFIGFASCSSVPKEVVELSYVMGNDLQAMNESYDKLIHQFYEDVRAERRTYLDATWYPRFLENWRDDGELMGIAKGERIWSEKDEALIDAPPGTDPVESLKTLNDWVSYALYAYEVKEKDLIKPLDEEEEKLREQVDKAFMNVMRANATITAHLNSLREVQEVQDEILEALDIKDLRNQINDMLVGASKRAADALEKIRSADAKVDNLTDQIESLTNSN